MRHFWDTREMCPHLGTPEIAAFAVLTCKKRGHKCQFLDEKGARVGVREVEVHSVKYAR
jgi:hypothetical protein